MSFIHVDHTINSARGQKRGCIRLVEEEQHFGQIEASFFGALQALLAGAMGMSKLIISYT